MLDFNTEPYFNDFSEDNKFYSILFRPSVAVQARELNQFQTILQNQISQHGSHIFKNGTVVIPGEFDIKTSINYLKLLSVGNITDIEVLIGLTLQNTTGLKATVVHAVAATTSDPATLYLSYNNSSDDNTTQVFADSETLQTPDGVYNSIVAASVASAGFGSISTINRGVYYVNGYFVLCEKQTTILDKYDANPSFRIGFNVTESIKTQDDIGYSSLLDNAQGSFNYAAPGAHRYYIDLTLTKLTIDESSDSFIELGRVVNGQIISAVQTTGYSQLEKTLARRTYDESGDYTIRPFQIDVREHRNNDRGTWIPQNAYLAGDIVEYNSIKYTAILDMIAGLAAPVHTSGIVLSWEQTTLPVYNRGIYFADTIDGTVGDVTKLAVGLEPGKAYVQGYELEKLATTYIDIDKPRNLITDTATDNNASIPTSVGNYVEVTQVHNLPPITTGGLVGLWDGMVTIDGTPSGNRIGSCRVRCIQSESGTGETTYCKMFLSDITLNARKSFTRDVKSFAHAASSFTANITSDTYSQAIGIVSTTSSSAVVVGTGTRFINGTPSQTVQEGDWIYYGTPLTPTYVGKVLSVDNDQQLTLTAPVVGVVTNAYCMRVQTQLNEPSSTSLVFELPHSATQSVTDHIYYVTQQTNVGSVVSNSLNISVPTGTLLPDASNYYVQDDAGNSIGANNFTVEASNSSAILTFASAPNTSYTVYATVYKTGVASRKIKTLTSASSTFTLAQANSTVLNLPNTDCYKLVSIMMGTTNISDWYAFDTGQKDTFYDYGKLTLKGSYPTPSAAITVEYQYFSHSAGDFCDLGSYTNIDYKMIPYYGGINLRDAIDFRPNMASYNLCMPKRGYNMSVDLTYYLSRQDKISIDINGNFFDTKGSSSLNPGIPSDSSTGMSLCTLFLSPFTFDVIEDVEVTKIENKRYTMRDIGKLEKRIVNLEYYTSLSLLEQETKSLSITDSSGLDRFKNGFIVDNFSGHNIGDISSPDYVCSIDMGNNELRPISSVDNVNLIVDTVNSSNYKLYGDVATLPLDSAKPHVMLAQNTYASRTEFVNPFAVFTFLGDVKLNPSSDDWFEVTRMPDIVTNKEGNFTILTNLAARTGMLDTVWNSWQTQWTGAPVSQGVWRTNQGSRGHGMRSYWTEALATTSGQARTGTATTAVAKIDTQIVDDKVLSVAAIPYIRSRYILIQAKCLKPNTHFYPSFDNVDISSYCTPASILTYTPISGTFDSSTNAGIAAAVDPERTVNGDTQVCLNIGDIITGAISGKKAVVVGKERILNNGVSVYKLYVLNVTGTFVPEEHITGSISGAVGAYNSITVPTNLTTGSSGDISLLFKIPNTDSVRFRTGTREFKLIDNSLPTGEYTSRGISNYSASGTIQTKQASVIATRNVEFVQSQVTENRTIVNTSSRIVADTGWYDPLAQTFLVDSVGGAFLSKIDLFFASKDDNIPVTVEIREVVNGYPGSVILPFSKITVPSEHIALSSTKVTTWDGVNYPKYDMPTTITFPSPVYVKDKTEYAIVLISDSNKYKVWISQMGDAIPDSSDTISKQPYLGVLFKSQNSTTWTASQDQDLKFTLYRANFNTNVSGSVVLTNDKSSRVPLEANPIQTLAGSTTVRVWHPNHGFRTGSSVTLSGATSDDATILTAMLNTTFTVSNPQLDSYTIVVAASATDTSFIGGTNVMANRNIKYETIQPAISALGFPETKVEYAIETKEWSTGAMNLEETCIANDNNYYTSAKTITHGSTGSLNVRAIMSTTNPALTPVIDTHGTSAVVIGNKVDSPNEVNTNIALIDRVALWSASASSFAFVDNTITSAVTGNQVIMQRIVPGSYVEVYSATTPSNDGKYLVLEVDSATGTLTVANKTFVTENARSSSLLYYYNSFFDEITPTGSSTHSKYVSRAISLANQSNLLRIKFAVCAPTETEVLVYYRIGTDAVALSSSDWVLLEPDTTMPKTAIGSNTFLDVDYTASDLASFNVVCVKLVMKSTNTAAVPRMKDLRIIACAA